MQKKKKKRIKDYSFFCGVVSLNSWHGAYSSQNFVGDICPLTMLLKIALSRVSIKILIHNFFLDTGIW